MFTKFSNIVTYRDRQSSEYSEGARLPPQQRSRQSLRFCAIEIQISMNQKHDGKPMTHVRPGILRNQGRFVIRSNLGRFRFAGALVLLAAFGIAPTEAQEALDSYGGRKTLFQWSGSTEEGGPPGFDEPLVSDRPDFVEASVTVGRGVRQIEMGYTYYFDRPTNHSVQTFPEILFRAGALADWLEFRVGFTCASEREGFGALQTNVTGALDMYLGMKLALTPQDGILPEMAIVPQMLVPTGHPDLTFNKVLPGVNWLYGWEISDFLSLGGSTQANLLIDDLTNDEFLLMAQAFTIGYTLTEQLGAYTEWFMFTPAGAETAHTEHYLDSGFTYKFTNDLQFDIRAGKGVSAQSIDYFVGSGVVMRW